MTVYYILLAFVLLAGWYVFEYKKSKQGAVAFMIITAVALVAVATLRYSIGFDYFSYETIYNDIVKLPFGQAVSTDIYKSFPLYAALNWVIGAAGGNYTILLLLCNILMTGCVFWVIWRYSKLPWMSVFVYITLQFFAHTMNLFRQSIAMAIILLAYGALRERKPIPYFILILLAATIHISALVMLPVYFIINLEPNWKQYAVLGGGTLLFYIFSDTLFTLVTSTIFTQYASYKDSIYWKGSSAYYLVVPAIYFGIVLLFRKKLMEMDSRNKILINSAFYTFLLYFLMTRHFIFERLSIYVFPFAVLLIPEIIDSFKLETLPEPSKGGKLSKEIRQARLEEKNAKFYRNWAIGTVVFICFIYFGFAVSRGYHKVYPYVSIFNKEAAVSNEDYVMGNR
ncbi:MAG: EpsG family protein [Angelakisella sp.]|nr:EpsG family protein [Angelakisella sp.]